MGAGYTAGMIYKESEI